jgi:hypothetical protein
MVMMSFTKEELKAISKALLYAKYGSSPYHISASQKVWKKLRKEVI